MPSAPLFYQPLVLAHVQATPIGDKTTVFDSMAAIAKQDDAAQKEFGPAIQTMLGGMQSIQQQFGATPFHSFHFSYDEPGYIANRVTSTIEKHPGMLDSVSPDQAAELGAKLVQEANKELEAGAAAEPYGFLKAVGDTLEVSPEMTRLFQQHWTGKEQLTTRQAIEVGVQTQREIQRSVTPTEPDSVHPKLQWLEDAGNETLAMFPNITSQTLDAMGVKHDKKAVEALVASRREYYLAKSPLAESLGAVDALLGVAGVKTTEEAGFTGAFDLLQKTPLDGVPGAIGQAIAGAQKLPPETGGYLGARIVETGGTRGNVKGLLAEIEQMKQPKPVEPPDAEPGTKPPGEELPPGELPPGEPPPGETPPVPVDPPKPDEATSPPAAQPVDPPASTAPTAGTEGMSEADAKAFQEFLAQITAAQQAQQQADGKGGPVGDPRLYHGEPAAAEPPVGDSAAG